MVVVSTVDNRRASALFFVRYVSVSIQKQLIIQVLNYHDFSLKRDLTYYELINMIKPIFGKGTSNDTNS